MGQRTRAEGTYEVIGECLDGRVADVCPAERGEVIADRVQQVGLAETGRGVQKQRVVGQPRELCDSEGRRMCEPVAVPDDALVKAVARVQARERRLNLARRVNSPL